MPIIIQLSYKTKTNHENHRAVCSGHGGLTATVHAPLPSWTTPVCLLRRFEIFDNRTCPPLTLYHNLRTNLGRFSGISSKFCFRNVNFTLCRRTRDDHQTDEQYISRKRWPLSLGFSIFITQYVAILHLFGTSECMNTLHSNARPKWPWPRDQF